MWISYLLIMSIVFHTIRSSSSVNWFNNKFLHEIDSNNEYIRNTDPMCYRYGDCIDVYNTENEFFINRLNYMLITDALTRTNTSLNAIEQILNISTVHPHTPNYEPLTMCWPKDIDLANPAGTRFLRKMYKTYILADQSNKASVFSGVFLMEIANRVKTINNKLYYMNDTMMLVHQTVHFLFSGNVPMSDTEYDDDKCYRVGDCIDNEYTANAYIQNLVKFRMNSIISMINDSLLSIERKLNITFVPKGFPPFQPVVVCVSDQREITDIAYANKLNNALISANNSDVLFYTMRIFVDNTVDRLQLIKNALIRNHHV